MKLLFENLVADNREAFIAKVIEISTELKINPNWLMLTMYIETARTFSPAIQNSKSGATGLIQFMPATARNLGTTTQNLAQMSNVEQLDYVKKYLSPYKGRMKDVSDVYLAVFFPLAIGKADNWVLETKTLSAQKVASWNPLYDLNKDGRIQKYEVKTKILTFIPKDFTGTI